MKKYFEFVNADSAHLADVCGCEIGQTVGRVYQDGEPLVFKGDRAEVEAAVAAEMSK